MRTGNVSGGRRSDARRSTRSRAGAHASHGRPRWLVPLVAVAGVLSAVLVWQTLQHLFAEGTPTPVSSTTSPSGAAGPGVVSEVRLGDTGGLHLVETLTFDSPQGRVDLALPRRGGAGAGFEPAVTSLIVRGPGPAREAGTMQVGDQATVRLSSPSTRVVLEYDADGVVQHSGDASNPDRALALVTPLVVLGAGDLPTTVDVRSVKVLNVGCLQRGVLEGCGTRTRDGWTVETSGGDGAPDVFAQVNLAVR